MTQELQEQAEKAEQRLEALEEARAQGTLVVIERIRREPALGWVGERGTTVAVWGEGLSFAGPGGVWFNRER